MAKFTLADLKDRVIVSQQKAKEKQNKRYHLARKLGFNSYEAAILQNQSERVIHNLAKERQLEVK